MATVTIEDFIKPHTNWKENSYMWLSKGIVCLYGFACIGMAALASSLGEVLQAALSILGLVGGPLVGLFTIGLLTPFANSIGAFFGLIIGLCMSTWVYVGSRIYPAGNEYVRKLPFNYSSCASTCYWEEPLNASLLTTAVTPTMLPEATTSTIEERPAVAELYSMSYLYLSTFGMLGTIVSGVIISLSTCGWRDRRKVDPNLMCPFFDHFLFKWLPDKAKYILRCCVPGKDEEYDLHAEKAHSMSTFAEVGLSPVSLSVKYDAADNVQYSQDSKYHDNETKLPI